MEPAAGDERKLSLKRKRGSASEDNVATKVLGKLHHGAREMRKAAKKAKTFETQKIIKKIKGLRAKKPEAGEIAELEAQLEIIKEIDHEPFGNTALKTKLKKDRLLARDEHVLAAISAELNATLVPPSTSAAAKVHAHLLSSKALAAEVATVVQSIRNVLNPPARTERPDEDRKDEDEDIESVARPRKAAKMTHLAGNSIHERADGSQNIGVSDTSPEGNGSHDQDDLVVEADDEEIDDGGWESGSIDSSAVSEDGSKEEIDSTPKNGRVLSSRADKSNSSTAAQKTGPETTPASSTFLPSLQVGFTRGDSDASNVDESELKAVDGRKNRRGQRARRAIWEKKYGRNANHVKKQQEESANAPERRKLQDRAQASGPRGYPHVRNPSTTSHTHPSRNLQKPPGPGDKARAIDKARKEDKPLHPSWEAKKRLKEKLNPGIVAPQGKKITFD